MRNSAPFFLAPVSLLIAWTAACAPAISGCTMTAAARRVGNRVDRIEQLDRAARAGSQLAIFVRVEVIRCSTAEAMDIGGRPCTEVIERGVPRWGLLNLATVPWVPLPAEGDTGAAHFSLVHLASGPLPYEVASDIPQWDLGSYDEWQQTLPRLARATGHGSPLSLYVAPDANDTPFLVSTDSTDSENLRFVELRLWERDYETPWAGPVRYVVVPLAVLVDIVLLPIDPILFLWFGHAS